MTRWNIDKLSDWELQRKNDEGECKNWGLEIGSSTGNSITTAQKII